MGNTNIKVNFIYGSHPDMTFKCKSNQKLKDICEEFLNQNGIDFNSVYFMINGKRLKKTDFYKTINLFTTNKSKNFLNIIVHENIIDINNSENRDLLNFNKNTSIIFSYKSDFIEIKCSIKSKMADVTKNFANDIGTDINALDFYYKNKKLKFGKTFDEIINHIDLKKGKMEIKVLEKKEKQKQKIKENNNDININNQKVNKTFCNNNKNKKQIFLITLVSVILIVILIIFFVILKKDKKGENPKSNQIYTNINETETIGVETSENEKINQTETEKAKLTEIINETEIITQTYKIIQDNTIQKTYITDIKEEYNQTRCNETCLECNYTNGECLNCSQGYDLYKGTCIKYAFIVSYSSNINNKPGKLYNKENITGLYAIKIKNEIVEPNPNFQKFNFDNKTVYFYLEENNNISLSYMFKSIHNVINISFNENINNFSIIDMKGMFSDCPNLFSVSFYPFQGRDLIDISYLFSESSGLKYVNFSFFNSSKLKYMNQLFYSCSSLEAVDILKFNTNKVINMYRLFFFVLH